MTREQRNQYNRTYYAKHREEQRQRGKEYYKKTKETRRITRLESGRKSRIQNRDKIAAWNKEYYKEHREDYYKRHVSYRYGLSPEEYTELVTQANGLCQICGKPFLNSMDRCIDHDHNSGLARGLLCRGCNLHLGWFEQYGELIIDYLARTKKAQVIPNCDSLFHGIS